MMNRLFNMTQHHRIYSRIRITKLLINIYTQVCGLEIYKLNSTADGDSLRFILIL